MQIERETVVEAVAAIVPALLATVALYLVGTTYTGESGLSPQGGRVFVVVIAAFVVLVTVVGLLVSRSGD